MRYLACTLGLTFLACASCVASADDLPTTSTGLIGQRLAATCAACHGTDGVPIDNTFPRLAGQKKQALLASLQAFKSGSKPATVMQQLSKGYSDQQLEMLAEYFSSVKIAPSGDKP